MASITSSLTSPIIRESSTSDTVLSTSTGATTPSLTTSSASSGTTASATTSSPTNTSSANSITTSAKATSSSTSLGTSAGTSESTAGSSSSNSSAGTSSILSATSTISSTLTAPLTTSVQATVTSTGANGALITTVVTTETVLSAGSIVTSTSSPSIDSTTSSTSHIGAIVGGVVGGVGGLLIVLAILFFVLRRAQRKRELDEAFDGNFDPDRIVRAGGTTGAIRDSVASAGEIGGYAYAGGEKAKMKKQAKRASRGMPLNEGTLPAIPIEGSHRAPEMEQLLSSRNNFLDEEGMYDDDGMGGRLNGTSIGGGIVTPYTLYNPNTAPPSPAPSSSYNTSIPYNSTVPLMSSDTGKSTRATKEREAFGGRPLSMSMSMSPVPSASMSGHSHPNYQINSSLSGRSPSPGTPSPYAAQGAFSPQGGKYSPVPSRASSASFTVMNPSDSTSAAASSSKYPEGPAHVAPKQVLVHQDGGRVPANIMDEDAEDPHEIPPTYDSLNAAGRQTC